MLHVSHCTYVNYSINLLEIVVVKTYNNPNIFLTKIDYIVNMAVPRGLPYQIAKNQNITGYM